MAEYSMPCIKELWDFVSGSLGRTLFADKDGCTSLSVEGILVRRCVSNRREKRFGRAIIAMLQARMGLP